jgi:hypothetical protein
VSQRGSDHIARDDRDEPFLQRWSRLKSESRDAEGSVAAETDLPEHVDGTRPAPPPEPVVPAEPAAPTLPDLDLLDQDSDYSAFLGPKVDRALRRKALRKLFHSPKFNVCDGLDDYCDDFTQWSPLGEIVTADMRHHLERAARELVAKRDAADLRTSTDEGDADCLADGPTGDAAEQESDGTPNSDDRGSA